MKLLALTPILSLVYLLSSFIIGPITVLYALGRGRVGMDCSDSSWHSISEATKATYYNDAALIMIVVSVVMLVIGCILLIGLLSIKRVSLAILVALIMAGYGFIITQANTWNC